MDEEHVNITQAADEANDRQEPVITAGSLLQSMRKQSGQEIECIASALKITPAQLHALEADDLGPESSLYFSRALAARVCRHLKQDPTEVLAKMPTDTTTIVSGVQNLKRMSMKPTPINRRSRTSVWMGLFLVALILAAAAMYAMPWLQQQLKNMPKATDTDKAMVETQNIPTIVQPETTQPPSTLPPEAAVPQEGVLEFTATGKTWIKISSSDNTVIYEGKLNKGQTHQLTLTQYPVNIVIGNAKNTKVLHNGQALDLSKYDKKGVARLELNFEEKQP